MMNVPEGHTETAEANILRKQIAGNTERLNRVRPLLSSYQTLRRQLTATGGIPTRFVKQIENLQTLEEYLTKDIAQMEAQIHRAQQRQGELHDMVRRCYEEARERSEGQAACTA